MSFDLDAVIAEEKKGDQPDPFPFTFDKQKYLLPGVLDGRVLTALDDGRLDRALRMLAGPEQWEKIEASPQTLTLQSIDSLLGEWAKHCAGTTLGKSARSTARSKSTRATSKRTSKGSTASASLRSVPRNSPGVT